MADYNVLTYAAKEVGGETDTPICISRAKSVYEHIKGLGRNEPQVEEKPQIPTEKIAELVIGDMNKSERPQLGNVGYSDR